MVRFIGKIRPTTAIEYGGRKQHAQELFQGIEWQKISLVHPRSEQTIPVLVARFANARLCGVSGEVIVAQIGGVTRELHRDSLFGFSNALDASSETLVRALGWTRWIREDVRRRARARKVAAAQGANDGNAARAPDLELALEAGEAPLRGLSRPNNAHVAAPPFAYARPWNSRRSLARRVGLVELFAGAGGMALGFLQAHTPNKKLELLFSGEIEPIYAQTLRANHRHWNQLHPGANLPADVEATDLAGDASFERIKAATAKSEVSIVVGGPPCQGFSAANRNSWSSDNPNNRLVEVFFRHVEAMKPRVFLMENVQGILWTNEQGSQLSVADELQRRLEHAGYLTFPHLLDAAWFGVPQHRLRYFLLGVHRDLGYTRDDFGAYGPFPAPTHGPGTQRSFVTVREAIADLPAIENGETRAVQAYCESIEGNEFLRQMRADAVPNEITDHITSRHADYVLERYRQIPMGGNWQSIAHLMTNYADIKRTHSNIYRRLEWDAPSITMGHYRKSMLIHPDQHRGLSLREAMRLQSFPDWVRFAGNAEGKRGGLMHQQQQLANAVCPLLLRAIASEILKL